MVVMAEFQLESALFETCLKWNLIKQLHIHNTGHFEETINILRSNMTNKIKRDKRKKAF